MISHIAIADITSAVGYWEVQWSEAKWGQATSFESLDERLDWMVAI